MAKKFKVLCLLVFFFVFCPAVMLAGLLAFFRLLGIG